MNSENLDRLETDSTSVYEEESSLTSSHSSVVANSSNTNELNTVLDEFRNNWQRELKNSLADCENSNASNENGACTDSEKEYIYNQSLAESLFRKGMELEQCGKVYDAIKFYKKAEQLIPDIEFKFYEANKLNPANNLKKVKNNSKSISSSSENVLQNLSTRELVSKFHLDLAESGLFISNNQEAGVVTTGAHISKLPIEILIYIFRWVVSSDLDLRSLEQCSAVCKGFYICARDEEIWRQACYRVWGSEDDFMVLSGEKYNSWRQMYIERPRINFHGCYISKTTYLRLGENSFQDQYYPPVHLIEYYRYIRFMANGIVYMMTSSDEPICGVVKMKNLSQPRSEIIKGTYRLDGDKVTIVLNKNQRTINNPPHPLYRNRANYDISNLNTTKYCIEFTLIGTSKRRNSQLHWKHYSIQQFHNKIESKCVFELNPSKYPPLWFSPVRSYNIEAGEPLKW